MFRRLRQLGSPVRPIGPLVRPPPRQPEPHYNTAAHAAWAREVVQRAGGRCEAVDRYGSRCSKAAPLHRMFADHRIELKDGGQPFSAENGMCLCGAHHTRKTIEARVKRLK
jgi:5-methylcytosine-specific restriction enzyme A